MMNIKEIHFMELNFKERPEIFCEKTENLSFNVDNDIMKNFSEGPHPLMSGAYYINCLKN